MAYPSGPSLPPCTSQGCPADAGNQLGVFQEARRKSFTCKQTIQNPPEVKDWQIRTFSLASSDSAWSSASLVSTCHRQAHKLSLYANIMNTVQLRFHEQCSPHLVSLSFHFLQELAKQPLILLPEVDEFLAFLPVTKGRHGSLTDVVHCWTLRRKRSQGGCQGRDSLKERHCEILSDSIPAWHITDKSSAIHVMGVQ